MTRTRKYKRHRPEFKREALRRASEDGNVDKAVCNEPGISARPLWRWRYQFRLHGESAFIGQGRSRDESLTHLKRELAKSSRSVIF
jgi:transposase-like protein